MPSLLLGGWPVAGQQPRGKACPKACSDVCQWAPRKNGLRPRPAGLAGEVEIPRGKGWAVLAGVGGL